ncbi:MAG TPA: nitrogen regulation protein NR(II) [Gammaproteobacteria bacterium]|nr:nitrogen regulation protein NR(II) [Gammaproteobacteria bacterium]
MTFRARMFNEHDGIAVLNQLATAVIQLDAQLRVREANPAAENLIMTSIHKLRGLCLEKLFPGQHDFLAAVTQAVRDHRSFTERDLQLTRPNLEPMRVDCIVSPRQSGDGAHGVVLELTSTERQQRIQAEENKLIQNQISTALMQGLAHEVKNPLGGIRGAAQLLERELTDPQQREYTQIIIGEADRLRKLVDRMLGPRSVLQPTEFNVHEVLEHVRQVVEMEARGRIAIHRDYDPSLPDLQADRDLLIQAFLNLVRNSVQALGERGGNITLRTRAQRKFTIGSRLHRLVIRVEVLDDGPGVDPALAGSIFFPMVSGRAEGSGLGLPIAQSLVNRQGGLIDFTSAPGNTVFTVWLPMRNVP